MGGEGEQQDDGERGIGDERQIGVAKEGGH
jgi:hypothetical protein